jgi:hypothetical protein
VGLHTVLRCYGCGWCRAVACLHEVQGRVGMPGMGGVKGYGGLQMGQEQRWGGLWC